MAALTCRHCGREIMFDGRCWVHFTDLGEYDGVACSDDAVASPPEDYVFPSSPRPRQKSMTYYLDRMFR